ncbi:hypothetical protein [Sutcliffiella cohnii]|uniref:hypothetical protein n=1 Tax=Sutcliffiella cohnii TaxID=33932 RepID=UPI000832816D|nr:hypothetical protein [Sutcliffiella cohnii]
MTLLNVRGTMMKKLFVLGTIILGLLVSVNTTFAQNTDIPQCSMTIEQGKHTESSPAKASGVCGEKDAVWGYYVPNLDTFVVRGMVNRDVTQNGQVFDVPLPGDYSPKLTVYIVRKAVEPAPPKEEPKPSNPTPPKEEKPEPKPSNPTPPKEEKPAPKPSNPTPPKEEKPASKPSNPTPPKEEKTETKPSTQKVETQSKNSSTSVTNKQTETKNSSTNDKNVSVNSTKEEKDDSSVTNKEEKQNSENTDTEGEDENNVEDSEDVEADSTDDEAAIDNNSSSELEVVESKEKSDDTDSKQSKSFLAELPNSVKWVALPSVLTLSIAGGIYWWFRKKGMI